MLGKKSYSGRSKKKLGNGLPPLRTILQPPKKRKEKDLFCQEEDPPCSSSYYLVLQITLLL
jgi:hypothetical protein